MLGGKTACLHEGRVEQFSPTLSLYRDPDTLTAARLFSDPPLNSVKIERDGAALRFAATGEAIEAGAALALAAALSQQGDAARTSTLAVRGHHLRLSSAQTSETAIAVRGRVDVTEITGSETFVHFDFLGEPWVALLEGIHSFANGAEIEFSVDARDCLLFSECGARLRPPAGGC